MDKYCKKCGARIPETRSVCNVCGMKLKSDNEKKMSRTENFFTTNAGRYIIIASCCAIIWGITLALWTSGSDASFVVILICAFFGWKVLNGIQPTMFLWLSWVGWVIYFLVKLILSALIGLFVAPFVLGKMVGNKIYESTQIPSEAKAIPIIIVVGAIVVGAIVVIMVPVVLSLSGNISSKSSTSNQSLSDEVKINDTSNISSSATNSKATDKQHQYKFIITDTTWKDANSQCKKMGGHLVTFDSNDEFANVISLIKKQGYEYKKFYIGGSRESDGQNYKWLDINGNYYGDILNSSTHWLPNDPSYVDGEFEEMYMMTYYYDKGDYWAWADIPNDVIVVAPDYKGKIGYICEIENK